MGFTVASQRWELRNEPYSILRTSFIRGLAEVDRFTSMFTHIHEEVFAIIRHSAAVFVE